MGPGDWIKKYVDSKLKAWEYFFDWGYSIEELEQVVVNILKGMESKSYFMSSLIGRIY